MMLENDGVTVPATPTGVPVAAKDHRPGRGLGLRLAWYAIKDLVKRPFYSLYLHRLRNQALSFRRPKHLALIMDGNRRFARDAGFLSSLYGHRMGARKLQEVLEWAFNVEIEVVTVWCFSIENFQRSAEEVEGLLRLFEDKTRELATDETVHRHRVRVRFIGKLELLPETLREEIRRLEEATESYDSLQLNIAMAYGGREEITEAFRAHIGACAARGESVESIVEGLEPEAVDPYLYTSGQPEPDLILRTSGEVRMSGFLLWQSAYSELYFTDAYWPAFREIDFLRALRAYDQRQRRFGR